MSTELGILAFYGLVIILNIVAQVSWATLTESITYLAGPRDESHTPATITGRLKRATDNGVTAMAYFAPAVLILQMQGLTTANTLLAAQTFLVARVIYVGLYAAGVAWLRTIVWIIALLAVLYLYWVALV